MSYATACLGELRLLDSYGLPRTEPDAFLWRPTATASHRASMLRAIREASAPLSLPQILRRMWRNVMRGMQIASALETHELAWLHQ